MGQHYHSPSVWLIWITSKHTCSHNHARTYSADPLSQKGHHSAQWLHSFHQVTTAIQHCTQNTRAVCGGCGPVSWTTVGRAAHAVCLCAAVGPHLCHSPCLCLVSWHPRSGRAALAETGSPREAARDKGTVQGERDNRCNIYFSAGCHLTLHATCTLGISSSVARAQKRSLVQVHCCVVMMDWQVLELVAQH